jgi:hypothetical protein
MFTVTRKGKYQRGTPAKKVDDFRIEFPGEFEAICKTALGRVSGL